MRLAGLHHITMITADAQRTVDTYASTLGLQLVKQTVNFDDPGAYHLYFGDESGSPGSILTWFEYPGARPGAAGAGMIDTIELGVPSAAALDFWERRLAEAGMPAERVEQRLAMRDTDGLAIELVVADPANRPLRAGHPEIPPELAITGIEGARALVRGADAPDPLLTKLLGFEQEADGSFVVSAHGRRFRWRLDEAGGPGRPGAGTVHHIAWASEDAEQLAWLERLGAAGQRVTPVQDRDYFRSIYFREPRGVLFEIATLGPGFAVDEDPGRLGRELRVPAMHAALRERIEQTLKPLVLPPAGTDPSRAS